MKVIVRGHGAIKRFIGSRKSIVELGDQALVRDLILKLGGKIAGSDTVFLGGHRLVESELVVLVNGRNIRALNGIDTALKGDDLVTFMPVIVGG